MICDNFLKSYIILIGKILSFARLFLRNPTESRCSDRFWTLQKVKISPTLPSIMLDLRYLREHREEIGEALKRKKFHCDLDQFFQLDGRRREKQALYESLRGRLKRESESLRTVDRRSEAFRASTHDLRQLSSEAKAMEVELRDLEKRWTDLYLSIPNLPDESVPVGRTEADNLEVFRWGDREAISSWARPHYEIPGFDRAIDFGRGAKVTGAGFPFYIGAMARLVRALLAFFLDQARCKGYLEMLTPILVNGDSATATGQLPDKESMMYWVGADGLYLIPTAEVPVTNFFRDELIEWDALPIYRCAHTPCFRREAGSWGRDVRGLNRLHQFDKVELVKWVHPDDSFRELELLRRDAEDSLQKLGLPYRVLSICSGDLGFPHAKQYDLEVWSGGQRRWLEVSSCSNFTNFQARRANIRFRPTDGGKPQFVHTLNGSGLAIPRVLAALLENNLNGDQSVTVPEVLRRWFGEDRLVLGEP